jgi:hydroxymethylglutaryl-CoA reductase (NADPH)
MIQNRRTQTINYDPSNEGIINRRNKLPKCDYLFQEKTFTDTDSLQGNIENFIGMTQIPTGIIGPVKVIGSASSGSFFVPLATSEGALVASYQRGAKACFEAGGITSVCLAEGVQRSPVFKFKTLKELGSFLIWVSEKTAVFKEIVAQESRYAELKDMKTNVEGNHLILTFDYYTGDASGQNMVTFCTERICQYILENCTTKPIIWFIEGNYSGDKKATTRSFLQVRGKKVTAEIILSKEIVAKTLKTTSKAMFSYWLTSTMGVIQSGAICAQGHYANGLAALFLATGQDVACVSESSVGITRMEALEDGSLYASVTLPNLIVGTVGGGTGLATQKECLQLMECYGEGNARKFSEITAAVVLAGELSIAAAISAGHFTNAHQKLGRKTNKKEHENKRK